jgi:hypothetical protein
MMQKTKAATASTCCLLQTDDIAHGHPFDSHLPTKNRTNSVPPLPTFAHLDSCSPHSKKSETIRHYLQDCAFLYKLPTELYPTRGKLDDQTATAPTAGIPAPGYNQHHEAASSRRTVSHVEHTLINVSTKRQLANPQFHWHNLGSVHGVALIRSGG